MQNYGGMQNQQPQPQPQPMGQNPLQPNLQMNPAAAGQPVPPAQPAANGAAMTPAAPQTAMQPGQPMGQPMPMGPSPAALRQVAGGEGDSTNNDILWVNRAKRAIAESQGDPYRQVQLIQQLRVLFLKERYGHNIQMKDK